MTRRRFERGFTLVEVMLALAILSLALVVLVRSVAGNVSSASESYWMGIATDLARSKMSDIEEDQLTNGFQETEQCDEGDFEDEGWQGIKWKYCVTPTELPSIDKLIGLSNGQGGEGEGSGSGSGSGSGEEGGGGNNSQYDKFRNSALGNMLGMFGAFGDTGGGGSGSEAPGADTAHSAGMIQMMYPMVQQILKQTIRKITLTVSYNTGLHKRQFDTILYITDQTNMAKILGPMWRQ